MSTSAENGRSRRLGGRTADITARVHRAVTDLVLEGGFDACTFSNVAERAGVDRSTLYRRFPDRWDAIIDTWMTRASQDVMPELGSSFADDLRSVLRRLRDLLESPLGPALLGIVAQLRSREGSDFSRTYFDGRMQQLSPMFEAAIGRGELPAEIDREALFTFAAGPMYFRMFIAARKVDDAFIDDVVENTCWLYCCGSGTAAKPR
jgi:AcrR family transcriptional regulator